MHVLWVDRLTGFHVERDIPFPYQGLEIPPMAPPDSTGSGPGVGSAACASRRALYRVAVRSFDATFIYFFLRGQILYRNHLYMIAGRNLTLLPQPGPQGLRV